LNRFGEKNRNRPIVDPDQTNDVRSEQGSVMPKHDWEFILGMAATLLLAGVGIGVLWFAL